MIFALAEAWGRPVGIVGERQSDKLLDHRALWHGVLRRGDGAAIRGLAEDPHPALRATFSRKREKGFAPSPACGRGLG